MSNPKPACPRCRSKRVYRSHSKTLLERLLKLAGARKRRCHDCGFDFFRWGRFLLTMKDIQRLTHRLSRYSAMLVSLALVLLAIRWLALRLAEPGPSG